jgi:hypothetical protein
MDQSLLVHSHGFVSRSRKNTGGTANWYTGQNVGSLNKFTNLSEILKNL